MFTHVIKCHRLKNRDWKTQIAGIRFCSSFRNGLGLYSIVVEKAIINVFCICTFSLVSLLYLYTLLWIKKRKILTEKKTKGKKVQPYPHPVPLKRHVSISARGVMCWCAGRKQSCQILTPSVQGLRSPRWPKIIISHWLEVSPLQQCTH